ncbi:PqqD family protein [Stackebrandtia nassauensis]|uniref:PqqD family protein n=1 Tax=Stackebrandtia nassauensis TaxID=283811 RepID=UPI0001A386F1|nr:PqqD family protein [Stackebrandtia nassauensis]
MRPVLAPGTCYTDLPDGGAALVTPTGGDVVHLDAVAAAFVKALSEHERDTAVTVLAEHFDVSTTTIAADLDDFTATLVDYGVMTGGAS